MAYGIIAAEIYTPASYIDADRLEEHGIPAWSKNGQRAVAVWDSTEDAISMALTAVRQLLETHNIDPYSIGRLEVGTESNVDMAKSIKSYLMDLFPLDHVDCEGVDTTNACYGSTAAMLNTLAWCREAGEGRRLGIVVATDTADMDIGDSAWRGASAVAMLVGSNPWIEIHPERVSCFKNTQDFLKPRYCTQRTPIIQPRESMNHYVDAVDSTIQAMQTKHGIDIGTKDAFVFHGGLCAKFMCLVEQHLLASTKRPDWSGPFDDARYDASHMGGLYTASLYVNMFSLLRRDARHISLALFAYGSGSTATLLHATVHPERGHSPRLPLDQRTAVSYETLTAIVNAKTTLAKHKGVFYRMPSDSSTVIRRYVQF